MQRHFFSPAPRKMVQFTKFGLSSRHLENIFLKPFRFPGRIICVELTALPIFAEEHMRKLVLFCAAILSAQTPLRAQESKLASADVSGAIYSVTGRYDNRNDYLRITKLNRNGDLLWEADYNTGLDEKPVSVAPNSSGIVILTAGKTNDSRTFSLINYSAGNYLIWERPGGAYDTTPISVVTDRDDNIYVCGNTKYGNQYKAGLWKFDRTGVPLWHVEYGSDGNSYAQQLQMLFDGNITLGVTVITGSASSGQYERRAAIYYPNGGQLR
jgi:hypothetical protein